MGFDEDVFPDAEKFDALRFYKLRLSKEGSGARAADIVASSQFIGVGPTSLLFGYGRHACPGRFFAANEIKMILATMLLNYDIKNPDGVEGRYANLVFGRSVSGSFEVAGEKMLTVNRVPLIQPSPLC
jgi:cytochrome P450